MKTHVFIQCCKSKNNVTAPAKDVYCSSLFRYSLQYARSLNPDSIHILSAKYGIISPESIISPYNVTLNDLREREKELGNTNYQENTAGYGCSKRFIHFPVWEELSEVCRIVHQELQSAYGTSWNRRTGIVVEETTKQMRIFQ